MSSPQPQPEPLPLHPFMPLQEALICAGCNTVYSALSRQCPRCTSKQAMALSRIVQPMDFPEDEP